MKELTDRQDEILSFIKQSIRESGYPPTVREIGDRFSITVKGAYDHLKAIEKKGYINCAQNKSRAIELAGPARVIVPDSIQVPLVGRIAAGSPIIAEENIEQYLDFPASMFTSGEFFALKIKGDSMIEEGIHDGDFAIIKKQNTAVNGEIVAALLEDEATLKIFKKTAGAIQLLPANKAYKPIIPETVEILGKLAGVFRKYA
ncbi:MAG: transcriptional repressor LexA [Spirochaetes bacterium]|nr:MAG: transcriptional repressor LexA [Spirochaetota bacterium]